MDIDRKKYELEVRRVNQTLALDRERIDLERAPSKRFLGPAVVIAAAIIATAGSLTQLRMAQQAKTQDDDRAKADKLDQDHRDLARFMMEKQEDLFKAEHMPRTRALLEAFYPEVAGPILSRLAQTLPSSAERQAIAEPAPASASAGAEDWKIHLTWASHDGGSPDCPQQYVREQVQQCLGKGNRSCVLQGAIGAARAGRGDDAMRMALLTQCHNPAAQAQIERAGPQAVAGYLVGMK